MTDTEKVTFLREELQALADKFHTHGGKLEECKNVACQRVVIALLTTGEEE